MDEDAPSVPQSQTILAQKSETETKLRVRKKRRVKRHKEEEFQVSFDIPGITKMVISTEAQKSIGCVVGEHVTAEHPWKLCEKEKFEDDLEVLENSSDFYPIRDDILKYPQPTLLVGYIPEVNKDTDEFYICLTEDARKKANEIITVIEERQEGRLQNSVLKTILPWKTLGSHAEVKHLIPKAKRALLEVEIESIYPVTFKGPYRFKLKLVGDAKDGYMEVLSHRTTFVNLAKKRIDAAVQAVPVLTHNEAQTICTYPQNACTQYEFEYEPVLKLTPEFIRHMKFFIAHHMGAIDDLIYVNSYINFYKDDYADLIKEAYKNANGLSTLQARNTEYTSLMDVTKCKGKMISSMSWHHLWTGIAAIAYSETAQNLYRKLKTNRDEVLDAIYDVPPVLLWSFVDCLHPFLNLETPREVTSISFCPYRSDLLVGGCLNGQIVIWDIKNRVEAVEQREILTSDQQRYRKLMDNLMKWMKNTTDVRLVRYAAVADPKYCHEAAVTNIEWISPYREVSKSGQIKDIPEDENRISLQFMTSSRDGTILCWNLQSEAGTHAGVRQRKLRRLQQCPAALVTDVSPFKSLNRILKPIFKVNVLSPGTTRNLPISALNMRASMSKYEELNPDSNRKFNVTDRVYFKPVLVRPTHPLTNQVVAGTVEGDFVVASWEGFSFNAGLVVNKENAKLENFAKFHDGPVTSLARSDIHPDLLLTVGGKVFAIWMTKFTEKPIMWRRSKYRYTYGVWNTFRPSIFRLCREDGYMEVWHLKTRSDRYEDLVTVSRGPLIGTFTQPQRLLQNITGIADYNGSFRLFIISSRLTQMTDNDNETVIKLLERETERKSLLANWQQAWKEKHADAIRLRKEREQKLQDEKEQEQRKKFEELQEKREQREIEEALNAAYSEKPEPGKFKEWAENQWRLKEEQRMNKVLLQKKALNKEFLEKQQLPLRKLIADEERKARKQEHRLGDAKKLFHNAVATLFPDAVDKRPVPRADPYAGGDPLETKASYYGDYLKLTEKCDDYVNDHKYAYGFNWQRIISSGQQRRQILSSQYDKRNHRNRRIIEKHKEELRAASAKHTPAVPQSIPVSRDSGSSEEI